jgi:hypothetical protein
MSAEQNDKLEAWWSGLSEDERGSVVQLEEGEPVPTEHQEALADALGLGDAAVEGESDGLPLRVSQQVAQFLADKRESFGGWTV